MRVFLIIFAAAALSGCATHPPGSAAHFTAGTAVATQADPTAGSAAPQSSGLPQFVIPVTGGPLRVALPLGGSVFLPLDGAPLAGASHS